MMDAKAQGAPFDVIARYETIYQALADANAQNRGLTEPVPLCTSSLTRDPATDNAGNVIAYRKPLMLLIDEFTLSTADSVAGMIPNARPGALHRIHTTAPGA